MIFHRTHSEALTDASDRKALWRCAVVVGGVVVIGLVLAWPAKAEVIGGRPAGCPHRFCGCALSLKIFGAIKPALNLAANWKRKFPKTHPAPGMVAARNGHVFQLVRQVKGTRWVVYDPNSGGGKIRIHERDIGRYTIVNPHVRMAETR
jgi:hypothetical protein